METPLKKNREVVGKLIFDNWNGLSPWNAGNQNILMLKNFARRLDADGYSGTEYA